MLTNHFRKPSCAPHQKRCPKPQIELLESRVLPATLGDFVARWDMQGNPDDDSSLMNTAIFQGGDATFVNQLGVRFGQSLQLDGTNEFVDLGAVANDVSRDFSFSAWLQTAPGNANRTLLGVNSPNGGDVFTITLTGDNTLAVYDGGSQQMEATNAMIVADGNTHHVAYVVSGNEGRLYVDGQIQATHQVDYILSSTDEWSLGQEFDGTTPSDFLGGIVDEVRVYNEALTDNQVVGLRTHPSDTGKQEEHAALLNLLPSTTANAIAQQDGNWSDAATWGGALPQADQYVFIPNGMQVTYDVFSDTSFRGVRVDGTLQFRTDIDTRLVTETMVSTPGSLLTIGTAEAPIESGVEAEILIDASRGAIDSSLDPTLLGRGLITHGVVRIHGAAKTTHLPLAVAPRAGDQQLTLASAPTGWQIGDMLVLAGTHHDENGSDADNTRFHDEVLEITGISGNVITFINRTNSGVDGTTSLAFDHLPPSGFLEYNLQVHVGNLSRNVVVRTLNAESVSTQERGHVMFMHSPNVQVNYAAFRDLGRTDKNQLLNDVELDANGNLTPGTGTNQRGRYSLHFHRTGVFDLNSTPALARGNVVWGSPGWGLVHHDSHVVLEDNVEIGANCTILPGAIIRSNVVVGAGSLVKGELAANAIYAGTPCRKIKEGWYE